MVNRPKPAAPKPVWLSESDVRSLVNQARKAKADLLGIIEGIEAAVSSRRETLAKQLSSLDIRARMQAIDSTASTLKAEQKAATNLRRTELLRSLGRMNDTAKAALPLYESPVAMLLRRTVASERRRTIHANLEAAGQAELKAFAGLAMASNDLEMAAAVVSRLHAITPPSARPVPPRVVADEMMGELQREMQGGLMEVDRIMSEAFLANRLFESGRSGSSGVGTIGIALKNRHIAAVGGKAVGDDV